VIEAGAAQYPKQLRIGNIRPDRRRTLELWRPARRTKVGLVRAGLATGEGRTRGRWRVHC
jgi:hypothetical protein